MTLKSSFLVSSKENYKRRIWVWVISVLGQLVLYPGILAVYLSRIDSLNDGGAYKLPEHYTAALQEAAADALGFQPHCIWPIALIGILIAVQGFSYLYDRKKVDMYHSVPVSAKRRFFVIYINGILMYIIPALFSLLLAVLAAAAKGIMTGRGMAECGLALLLNLLYFLVVYHTAILAVMLTGNVVVTGFAAVILLNIGYVAYTMLIIFRNNFFKTATSFFSESSFVGSVIIEYDLKIDILKQTTLLSELVKIILPIYGKWFVLSLLLLALAYLCYRKRPAEAAGKAMAFRRLRPVVKIIVSVVAGFIAGEFVYGATYSNVVFMVFGMIGGTVLCGIVMEVIYEADIRGALRHLVSTGIAVAVTAVIFCIFRFDLFGYDTYVPEADEIESVALDIGPYQSYWEWYDADESAWYISSRQYLRDNMFLTDVDAVCELVRKSQTIETGTDGAEEKGLRNVNVLYRLKSGKEMSRHFWIDFEDASNEGLLNRIIGTQEYREGFYLAAKDEIETAFVEMEREWRVTYSNGTIETQLPASESGRLREMWLKDMEQFDFTLAHNNMPCGSLEWAAEDHYNGIYLPVYESFTNTLAVLEEYHAYYPAQLRAEDVLSLEVTNWHNQDADFYVSSVHESAASLDTSYAVTAEFTDPEEIAEIVRNIYPSRSIGSLYWNEADVLENEYEVIITFRMDTDYPYNREYFRYSFLKGRVPDFVVEKTAFDAEK